MLRSCYRTDMQFFPDSPKAVPVRWFFCKKGAQPLPFPTVFGSRNWNHDLGTPSVLGEVLGSKRTYDRGTNFGDLPGDHHCGTADQFYNGVPIGQQPYPSDGCCDVVIPDNWCLLTEAGADLELESGDGCIATEDGP